MCNVWGRRPRSCMPGKGEQVLLALRSDVPANTCGKNSSKPPGSWGIGHLEEYLYPRNREEPRALYIAKAALQISDTGTFKAVEGITNAGGRLDVQKGYTSQLMTQWDTLYYTVNTHFDSPVVISEMTMRNQGVDLQHVHCLAVTAKWALLTPVTRFTPLSRRDTLLYAYKACTRTVSTGQPACYLYLAFGNILPSFRKARLERRSSIFGVNQPT